MKHCTTELLTPAKSHIFIFLNYFSIYNFNPRMKGKKNIGLNLKPIVLIVCHSIHFESLTQICAGHGSRAVAYILFARSEAGTVGSNPTQDMEV
jgi:hypothetical protein